MSDSVTTFYSKPDANRRQAGFSTLELMMAIVVLAIAVIGASLIPALSLGRNTDAKTYAANVAREVLDSYRGFWLNRQSFVNQLEPKTPTGLRFGCTIPAPTVEALDFDAKYELIPSVGNLAMRRVTVQVKCNQNTDITLSTLIGDPEPDTN
jgi:type II secretory pathway pseudopilin PulG